MWVCKGVHNSGGAGEGLVARRRMGYKVTRREVFDPSKSPRNGALLYSLDVYL